MRGVTPFTGPVRRWRHCVGEERLLLARGVRCFQILARRGANLIWVPGRDIPKVIPAAMPKLLAQNRLLVASPFDYGKPDRPTRATCLRRNEWIARAVSVGELSLTSASPGPD